MTKSSILAEIDSLKFYLQEKNFNPYSIKVLENVGEFGFVIKFPQFNEFDIALTIQIPSTYQLSDSRVILNLPRNKENDKELNEACKLIEILLQSGLSEPILVNFFTQSFKLISDCCKKPKQNETKTKQVQKERKNQLKSEKSQQSTISSKNDGEKLASMKTAGDVVKRIQWDSGINRDFIIVGYLDRFLGIKECSFNTFDWGDIVLADLGALAIPEHRICYFLYKGEKIWDKSERLDNVYGSTGSGITIYDVIKRLEGKNFEFKEHLKSELVDEEENQIKQYKEKPNYFISIPIEDKEIVGKFEQLINDLLESNSDLAQFVLPSTSLHLTVCTLKIDSKEEIEIAHRAVKNLVKTKDFLDVFQQPLDLTFQGFDYFYDKVFYIKCFCDLNRLKNIKTAILNCLQAEGIKTTGNYYDFIPHLTVFKLGKSEQSAMEMVSYEIIKKYDQKPFGTQIIKQLELCKMVDIHSHLTYPVEFFIKIEE